MMFGLTNLDGFNKMHLTFQLCSIDIDPTLRNTYSSMLCMGTFFALLSFSFLFLFSSLLLIPPFNFPPSHPLSLPCMLIIMQVQTYIHTFIHNVIPGWEMCVVASHRMER